MNENMNKPNESKNFDNYVSVDLNKLFNTIMDKRFVKSDNVEMKHGEIRRTHEDGETYYDFIDNAGTLCCMDGEECEIMKRNGSDYELRQKDGDIVFTLSNAEFSVATHQKLQKATLDLKTLFDELAKGGKVSHSVLGDSVELEHGYVRRRAYDGRYDLLLKDRREFSERFDAAQKDYCGWICFDGAECEVLSHDGQEYTLMLPNDDTLWNLSEKEFQIAGKSIQKSMKSQSLFNKELQLAIDGKLPENHIFSLGVPGEILQRCGFPKGQRIEMSLSRLKFKASLSRHPFELNDIFGLEKALQNPVAVFEYGNKAKSQNVVVNIKKGEKNFLAGIHFNQVKNNFDISTIRTLYPKENIEWLNWIAQGKLIYGNKKELQALTAQQRMNVADVSGQVVQSPLHEHCLKSIENILSKFGPVNNIFTDEYPFYKDVKLHGEIEKRFFTYYTSKGNLDARELATIEADEFYIALKNNDQKKINEYMREDFHEVNEIASEILSEYSKEKKYGKHKERNYRKGTSELH